MRLRTFEDFPTRRGRSEPGSKRTGRARHGGGRRRTPAFQPRPAEELAVEGARDPTGQRRRLVLRLPTPPKGDSGMSLGMRAGAEFVSSVVIGAALGWGLDWLIGTRPLFLIAFFFLGVAAAVWNVIRLTSPKGGGSAVDSRLSHTNAADKGWRRSAPAHGAQRLAKAGSVPRGPRALRRGGRRRGIKRRGDRSGTGDQSDRTIFDSPGRSDLDRAPGFLADQLRPLHAARGGPELPDRGDRGARRLGRSGPAPVARRDGLRVHRRHGAIGGGRARHALFPAGFQHLLLRPDLQSGQPHPLLVLGDQPDRHHGGARAPRLLHSSSSSASSSTG